MGVQVGAFVIAQHLSRRLDEDLTFFADAHLHTGVGRADIAGFVELPMLGVRIGEVLGHGIAFHQVQAQAAVPANELGRQGGRATASQLDLVQAQAHQNFAGHHVFQHGNAQQQIEFFRGHLGKHALLEFHPQTRHRNEDGGSRTLQILHEGVQGLGKKDVQSAMHEGGGFDKGAFKHVGQRQVGQHAVATVAAHGFHQSVEDALGGRADALEGMHGALGLSSGARGVNDHGQVGGLAPGLTSQRLGAAGDGVPGVVGGAGGQRQGDARQVLGHAGGLFRPFVQFADKQQAGLGVLQHKFHGVGTLRGEDGDGGVTRHPNRQFCEEEMRTVFGQDGDFGAMGQPQRLQMRRHAPRLIDSLRPGEVLHLSLTGGLGQEDVVGLLAFVVIDALKQHGGSGRHGLSLVVVPASVR